MDYKKLGSTDLFVSSLGFGAMRLPIPPDSRDFTKAVPLLHHAIKAGISFFDVGTFYCHNLCEEAFGLAISSLSNNIVLSGKNSTHQSVNENWTCQLKNTLHHFNREALDIYFIHYLEQQMWERHFIKGGVVEEVNRAKRDGLIKYLGFSSHDTPENIKKERNAKSLEEAFVSIIKENG